MQFTAFHLKQKRRTPKTWGLVSFAGIHNREGRERGSGKSGAHHSIPKPAVKAQGSCTAFTQSLKQYVTRNVAGGNTRIYTDLSVLCRFLTLNGSHKNAALTSCGVN